MIGTTRDIAKLELLKADIEQKLIADIKDEAKQAIVKEDFCTLFNELTPHLSDMTLLDVYVVEGESLITLVMQFKFYSMYEYQFLEMSEIIYYLKLLKAAIVGNLIGKGDTLVLYISFERG